MMLKMLMLIGSIQKDKLLHAFVSYIIYDLSFNITKVFDIKNLFCILISIITTSVFIIGKEIIDAYTPNNKADYKDIIASYIGLILCLIISLI